MSSISISNTDSGIEATLLCSSSKGENYRIALTYLAPNDEPYEYESILSIEASKEKIEGIEENCTTELPIGFSSTEIDKLLKMIESTLDDSSEPLIFPDFQIKVERVSKDTVGIKLPLAHYDLGDYDSYDLGKKNFSSAEENENYLNLSLAEINELYGILVGIKNDLISNSYWCPGESQASYSIYSLEVTLFGEEANGEQPRLVLRRRSTDEESHIDVFYSESWNHKLKALETLKAEDGDRDSQEDLSLLLYSKLEELTSEDEYFDSEEFEGQQFLSISPLNSESSEFSISWRDISETTMKISGEALRDFCYYYSYFFHSD